VIIPYLDISCSVIHILLGSVRRWSFFEKRHKKTFLSLEWKVGIIDMPQRTLPPLPFQPHRAILKGDLLNHKAEKAVK
jgi:hypothetical protein